jgi:hypothetical protein
MKKNKEFNKYVDKKIIERLGILAQYNKEKVTEHELPYKGEFIFSGLEKDRKSAAMFLIMLLDCLQKWALAMPIAEDGKTSSRFVKTYQML